MANPFSAGAAQTVGVMAQAIPIVTRADPTATRDPITEGYVSQPLVMARAALGAFQVAGTLNLEGLTLKRGELSTGASGEGFVDRRHPHAYLHELMFGAEALQRDVRASLFAGRGFVPFGSDDPMVRPLEKYPLNHHLAQILERLEAVVAGRFGPLVGELATFGGDEPLSPGSFPVIRRFGDSWAARLTLLPLDDVELSGSFARVASPEQRAGQGLDQRKTSLVARFSADGERLSRYAMAEWARTTELDQGRAVSTLHSALAEAALCRGTITFAARAERTERAEEESLADPFRSPRPAPDLSNLGISRWFVATASLAVTGWSRPQFAASPFVEVAHLTASRGNPPGIFDPELRYGSPRMWMYSAGIRLSTGMMHRRMGRYGAALPPESHSMGTMSHEHGSEMEPGHLPASSQCSF